MLPKIDFAFKLLFGDERSKNILAYFLKAVLPELADEEIEELTILYPHLKREFSGDKLEVLDMKARTRSKKTKTKESSPSRYKSPTYRGCVHASATISQT
jgi:predicted transposase/invertase (TIGR01784 family)